MYNMYIMDKSKIKIIYMGTPAISAYVLEKMILSGFNIVGVVAQPDRPMGRKAIVTKVPTKVVAEKYNIPVYQPEKIKNDYDFLIEINPDLILTFSYGQIVPKGVLDIPSKGCLNLHGSLLPKYRGASPVQTVLMNQEKITGVTLMEMTEKMDAGRMYAKEEICISPDDNSTSLFNKIAETSFLVAEKYLPLYFEDKLVGEYQDESQATYCKMIKPEQEKIDLSMSKEEIIGLINALSDEPGAYLLLDNEKFKIFKAKIVDDSTNFEIGEIISADKKGLYLQLRNGVISLLEIQKQGKKKMDYKSFLNGNNNILNKKLY